jgi:hypothetical protein
MIAFFLGKEYFMAVTAIWDVADNDQINELKE